jgi:hypothetical protein
MSDDLRRDAHATLTLCAAIAAAIAVAAATVRLTLAAPARDLLGYPFADQHPGLPGAAAILATNARKLAGVYGLALVAQAPILAGEAGRPRAGRTLVRLACDAGAVGLLAPSGALVAVALGAYGSRMAAAILPNGPLELAAFALALSVYRDARRRPVRAARALGHAATGLALLAAAALLETYAGPPT